MSTRHIVKNKFYKVISILFYFLSIIILIYLIKVRLTPNIYLETDARLIVLFTVCLFIYISGYILVEKLNYDKKILRINLIIYTLIYTITIFMLTLFEEIFGRNGLILINWNSKLLKEYIDTSFNIIPFKTVKLFINGYNKGIVSFHNFSINIIGNICAFMPYSIFLPLIFNKMNKYKYFLISMIFFVLVIEIMQFITMSGSCDIDDLILNVVGCSIMYFIIKIKVVNRFINKIFLLD